MCGQSMGVDGGGGRLVTSLPFQASLLRGDTMKDMPEAASVTSCGSPAAIGMTSLDATALLDSPLQTPQQPQKQRSVSCVHV